MNTVALERVESIISFYLNAHPPRERLPLRFGSLRIDLVTNSAALAAKLKAYYRDFLDAPGPAAIEVAALELPLQELPLIFAAKPPEPGKRRIKEEFIDLPDGRVVRKRLTGMVFAFGGGRHLAVGPCLANDNQIVNFINNRHIEHLLKKGGLLGHAAGVAETGVGIGIAGFAGMGKSTLSLHIMGRSRVSFVSNDRLIIERTTEGLLMHGVAKMPRVNPGTVLNNPSLAPVIPAPERERFAALPPEELWPLEHKYDAFIDECFGPGRFELTARMGGLVLLNWSRGGGPVRVTPVNVDERRDLLHAFMKEVGLFYEENGDLERRDFSEEQYVAFLEGVRVFELSGGIDFDAGAEACLDLLAGLRQA